MLKVSSGRWTRLDNVWRKQNNTNPIVICKVEPSLCPPVTDHLPVIMTVELPLPHMPQQPTKNFREVDWKVFNDSLKEKLEGQSPAAMIHTTGKFHSKVLALTALIQEVIVDKEVVPTCRPCPTTKRWWTKELMALKWARGRAINLAYKYRDVIDHPTRAEADRLLNIMAEQICEAKKEHWDSWLEDISAQDIYLANKYVTSNLTDLSRARILELKPNGPGQGNTATTNIKKAQILAESFFPPPPQIPNIPCTAHPRPLPDIRYYSKWWILKTLAQLQPYKAPGPDGIPNIVLMRVQTGGLP
ncbi:hypothetical protein E4T56_gene6359 [Termitomyces sp. T112]|nr:hypothetical protein E4T56_gene6359 [Termitomyces sp. T112]